MTSTTRGKTDKLKRNDVVHFLRAKLVVTHLILETRLIKTIEQVQTRNYKHSQPARSFTDYACKVVRRAISLFHETKAITRVQFFTRRNDKKTRYY